ncbi:NAD(P)H-hydrate dehydratase [Halonatronum saccharophilum]|uniref:NAD(P)H-hydrate dehydratase n=1 Tax=Halonatronum saccharophilum TaxID=150060 RepID=UPI000480EF06|nr:NAD(P)H-hydrate dehydratase [Halonatronum saccharophilum]
MKLVTGQQMGEIDSYTIEEIGIGGTVLMERAGIEVAKEVIDYLDDKESSEVVVLAGKGNNGGDGFVVSRILKERGFKVKTFLIGSKDDVSGDAKVNLDILTNLGILVKDIESKEDLFILKKEVVKADLIVDGLLGTGIEGTLRGLYPRVIELVNESRAVVVSIDIPSGVEAATGKVISCAVKAHKTITFALAKIGLILYPGADYVGELKVVDIGIPKEAINNKNLKVNLIDKAMVSKYLTPRRANTHKGDYGRLLMVGGSSGMTGAASLMAQAALKMGGGLITLGVPRGINAILEVKLTEVMTYPLAEGADGFLTSESLKEIEDLILDRDLLAFGPGIGKGEEIGYIVEGLVKKVNKPLVIDADGLNAILSLDLLKKRKQDTVLTPHPGELARLLGVSIQEVEEDRINVAKKFAQEYGVILLLKGARSIIASPKGDIYINPTGNAGMATGGSGDLLTGMISSLIGQGLSSLEASIVAAYLHGLAGDLGSKELTEYSLTPSDLLSYLPKAIKSIDN